MYTPPLTIPEHQLAHNLLVANTTLNGSPFAHSVVYIIEHAIKGNSRGVILNHISGKTVGDIIASDNFAKLAHLPIHLGGPVGNDNLYLALFEWSADDKLECQFHISVEQAIAALGHPKKLVRPFIGHAGWSKEQLHDEIKELSWFTAPLTHDTLAAPQDESLWSDTLQSLSPFHHIVSLTPDNPFLN